MNAVLGGEFSARINMNLREDKHWAYGARSMFLDAKGQRLFIGYAPVQTDKTKESIVEMDKELREILGERPPTAEELAKAQAAADAGVELVIVAVIGESRSPLSVCRNIVSGCQNPESLLTDAQGAIEAASVFLIED